MVSKKREFVIKTEKKQKTIKKLKKLQIYIYKYFLEQLKEWVEKFLQPIIDMMGSKTTWDLFPKIESSGFTGDTPKKRKTRRNSVDESNNPIKFATYDNEVAHWTAQIGSEIFNSFDECQIKDTAQFCATYTLMWLTGNLTIYEPQEEGQEISELDKYYFYTKQALDFIEEKILPKYNPNHHSIEEYWKCIKVLQKNPMMCLNVIELPK